MIGTGVVLAVASSTTHRPIPATALTDPDGRFAIELVLRAMRLREQEGSWVS